VAELGLCLIGQTARLAPADRVLYALRDVTATVESVPLIASSIMSKKLAEGIDALVLDCKVGAGAFMKTRERALALAGAIRAIGRAAGKRVIALLTDMNDPIGDRVGNALEVHESIETLRGGGPPDTRELTVRLGGEMLLAGGLAPDPDEGGRLIARALDDGSALATFRRGVEAQGGDPRVVDDPERLLPRAPEHAEVIADADGYVAAIAADDVGVAALLLGAGRRRKEDAIDPAVGIELLARPGDRVARGDPLALLHHTGRGAAEASERVRRAYRIAEAAPHHHARVLEVLR
jgi:pyrimidine-nucleoside phosphorylase